MVRRRTRVPIVREALTFAGQYGEGYEDVLDSFLGAVTPVLAADTCLILVLSPHPRTGGEVEERALAAMRDAEAGRASGDPGQPGPATAGRVVMAAPDLSTMELATASDVIVTWTSTVGTQAAFMGKEVIYFSPPEGFDTHLMDLGAASVADAETLPGVLNRALEDPASPEAIREALVAGGYVVDADRVMAERILEVVGSLPEAGSIQGRS
jgi:hypothetical protein